MGRKQKNLQKVLAEKGDVILTSKNRPSSISDLVLKGQYRDEILHIYRLLGGIDLEYTYRGRWDIVTEGYILELDEELHFNKYRLMTLNSPIYCKLEAFPIDSYRNFSITYSDNCLRAGSYGKKWRSNGSEKMFGPSQNYGDLSGNGSPRWKQRAFYDFVKDVSAVVTGMPVVRLSIYDTVLYQDRNCRLGDILDREEAIDKDVVIQILDLINKRL